MKNIPVECHSYIRMRCIFLSNKKLEKKLTNIQGQNQLSGKNLSIRRKQLVSQRPNILSSKNHIHATHTFLNTLLIFFM